jgi:hypothetical protein
VASELGLPTEDEEALRESLEMLEAVRLRPEAFSESIGLAASFDPPTEPGVRVIRPWSE